MHDMAVALDHHLLGDADRADLGDAADVVAAEVEQHQMLGLLLGVGQQLLGQPRVLGRVAPRGACAGDRPDGDLAVAQPHQDLGARPDHAKPPKSRKNRNGEGLSRRSAR